MTPVERAARAVSEYMACGHCDGSCGDCTGEARVVFESIDVDEMARVIERADMQWTYTLGLGGTRHGYIARAVHIYLLTGDESDE